MKDIEGTLSIDNKIWFNDRERCRLRICGFTKEQIEELKNSKFIDITLTLPVKTITSGDTAIAHISIEKEE